MKTFRLLLVAILSCVGASLLCAGTPATPAKAKTYSLAGVSTRRAPSSELIERAAHAVEARMAGMQLIANPENADHYVEVLFRNGTFEIYVDALPYTGSKIGMPPTSPFNGRVPYERSMELADIANTERARGIESSR